MTVTAVRHNDVALPRPDVLTVEVFCWPQNNYVGNRQFSLDPPPVHRLVITAVMGRSSKGGKLRVEQARMVNPPPVLTVIEKRRILALVKEHIARETGRPVMLPSPDVLMEDTWEE